MRFVVIGGVKSTELLVKKLHAHGFDDVHVFGYVPDDVTYVSGWTDLSQAANVAGYSFKPFIKVAECFELVRMMEPDWIFAVGLSQLIPPEMLALPSEAAIGFHPTALPVGRGRAAIAWLVLQQQSGAATFFKMRDGVDDGPILAQEPFSVGSEDDAESVEKKVLNAQMIALDRFLPTLLKGSVDMVEQNHSLATFFGRRLPEDGWINWNMSAMVILRLIRASTSPHPGAYSFFNDLKVIVLKAEIAHFPNERGVIGRILKNFDDGSFVVQCGEGHICIKKWYCDDQWYPRIGYRLGYYVEPEINSLRRRLRAIEQRLADLER